MTVKWSLEETYKHLEPFFKITVRIKDFNWSDCLLELQDIKQKQERTPEKVRKIYTRLMEDFRHHNVDNWKELR